jgi:hypothetical protein
MDLTRDEQCLVDYFRKLSPSCRDDLLAYSASLVRRPCEEAKNESEPAPNQCRLKGEEPRPEAKKTPIFTE